MNQHTNETPQPEIPSAPAAERAYVAATLAGRIPSGGWFLNADEFSTERYRDIYEAVRVRAQNDKPISVPLLAEVFAANGDLNTVGNIDELESLAKSGEGMSEAEVDEHGQTIRRRWLSKRLQDRVALAAAVNPDELEETIKILADELDTYKTKLNVSRVVPLTTAAKLRVKLGQQQWLWYGYIPVGQVTLIVSQQGQGKSNVAGDLCHRLATGTQWPDGSEITGFEAGDKILYLDAEGFMQGILTRFANWGTPDDVFLWPEGCDEKSWALNTPADRQRFESIIAQYRPKFVVIDSLSGANSLEEKDNDQMKALMQWLVALTQKYGLALVLIHHIRKGGLGELKWPIDLDSVRGASAITQFARVVHAIGTPDATQPLERRFETIKNNLGDFAPALGFRVLFEGLAWGDAPEVPKSSTPLKGAKAFLMEFLADGRRYADEVKEAADSEGLSMRTVERASKELGVERKRERGKEARWYWQLPAQKSDVEQFDDNAKGLYEE